MGPMGWTEWANLAGFVAVLAFLWQLHRDMADLRERMARVEGMVDGLTKRRESS